MNCASIAVLLILLALCALAIRRARRKGTPCLCGGDRRTCGGGCPHCHAGDITAPNANRHRESAAEPSSSISTR